jgi:hypothetical protein
MIEKEERKMLNSILERPWKRIVIDRLVVEDDLDKDIRTLVTEPEAVQKAADEYYKKQFKARKQNFDSIEEEWAQEYSPMHEINSLWYKEVLNPVEEQEWLENLNLAKKDTAPGASGITYIMIQRAGPKARGKFIELMNLILRTAIFPRK